MSVSLTKKTEKPVSQSPTNHKSGVRVCPCSAHDSAWAKRCNEMVEYWCFKSTLCHLLLDPWLWINYIWNTGYCGMMTEAMVRFSSNTFGYNFAQSYGSRPWMSSHDFSAHCSERFAAKSCHIQGKTLSVFIQICWSFWALFRSFPKTVPATVSFKSTFPAHLPLTSCIHASSHGGSSGLCCEMSSVPKPRFANLLDGSLGRLLREDWTKLFKSFIVAFCIKCCFSLFSMAVTRSPYLIVLSLSLLPNLRMAI